MNQHHGVAISHVARKLLGIIYAVCARGQSYDPTKISSSPVPNLFPQLLRAATNRRTRPDRVVAPKVVVQKLLSLNSVKDSERDR